MARRRQEGRGGGERGRTKTNAHGCHESNVGEQHEKGQIPHRPESPTRYNYVPRDLRTARKHTTATRGMRFLGGENECATHRLVPFFQSLSHIVGVATKVERGVLFHAMKARGLAIALIILPATQDVDRVATRTVWPHLCHRAPTVWLGH